MIFVNNTIQPIVHLEIIPGIYSNESRVLNFTWNCTHATHWYLDFEVDYEFKEEISFYEAQERVEVSFWGKKYFPASDFQVFARENETVHRAIPQQIDRDSAGMLAFWANFLAALGWLMLILLFFLGNTRRYFAFLRKCQIMVHLVITSVLVPANAMIFYNAVWHFVCYQLIDIRPIMSWAFEDP